MSENANLAPADAPSGGFGLHLLTLLAAVMIVGALLLVFNGRQLLKRYDNWRAGRVAQEAVKLMENQRWEAASQLILGAIRNAPDQPALMRVTADLFVRAYDDPQSALTFQRKVVASDQATPADQRRLAEILLLTGDTSTAKRLYTDLPTTEKDSRQGMELFASILRTQGETQAALQVLRAAWQRPPQDVESRLRLALLDEEEAFDSAKSQASAAIWDIARMNDSAALSALNHLCQKSVLTPAQAEELKALVEKHPHTNDALRYSMLRTYVRLNPLERERAIAAETKRTADRSPDDKFEFLRWLGLEGEHERILKILPQKSTRTDADLFLLYADALSAAQQWQTLLDVVQTGKPPITQPTAHVIQAQCYAHLKPDLIETRRHIRQAYELAGRDSTLTLRAAAVAERHHLNDLAVEGYRSAAQARPGQRLRLLEKVVELQRLDQDLQGMIATLQELRTLRPGSQSYADQLNYLRLVSGLEMEIACDEVLGFQQPVPTAPAPSTAFPPSLLHALAAWRFGQEDAMRQALESLPDPSRLAPGPRAVISCLYALSGREVEGFRLAEKISPLSLLEAEAPFLRRSLR